MLDDLTCYDFLQRQYSVATASVKAHTHTHTYTHTQHDTTHDVLGWIWPGLKPTIISTKDLGGGRQVQATLTCLARLEGQVSVTRLSR